MSKEIKKEEVKGSDVKSFLKNSVGKLAILAAAAASLSSCHHTWGFQIEGGVPGGYYSGPGCGHGYSHGYCGHVSGARYMPNKCSHGHSHY